MKMKIIGLGILLVLLGVILSVNFSPKNEDQKVNSETLEKQLEVSDQTVAQKDTVTNDIQKPIVKKVTSRRKITEEQTNIPYIPQAGQISAEKAERIAREKLIKLNPRYASNYSKIYYVDGNIYVEFDDYEREREAREKMLLTGDFIYLVIIDPYSGEIVMTLTDG